MNTIIAEVMMVLIVLLMSVIVFVFYSGVFGALLFGVSLHPENFEIVSAGSPSSGGFNASAVQPTPGGNQFSTNYPTCTGTINGGTAGNLIVPPGASCTINGATVQSVYVNYGASLTLNRVTLQAIHDNYSASITVANNTLLQGGISLYGTKYFSMTSSQSSSGSVTMDGVLYATYSNNFLGGTITIKNSGSVQMDSNTISGTIAYTNDQVIRLTNTTINGTLTFTDHSDPNCYVDNYTVSHTSGGPYSGICAGGAPSGGLDILNTGAYTITFNRLYLDGQPWNGVSWQLASGSTEQCGGIAIPVGPCTSFPVVIPANTMVHLTFSWVNPTPTSPVTILMWTQVNNYLEARLDPTAGLVCSTRSNYPPREPIGFC
ncbi:MAG TPA: hypothetical protein VFE96_00075 [Candidatus Bathyarchaeia archaeon]|jgi:hypothetical protein|nr:hypothetical protein [Candidatus Bathyarchaeia archaeon]